MLFSVALLTSAFLLFTLELSIGKSVVPHFGGSSSVWNTCLFFYQACLLVGYGAARLLQRFAPFRVQVILELALFALVLWALPMSYSEPASGRGTWALLELLVSRAGLPLVAVSTVAPLLQVWFTRVDSTRDPYFLYSASNAGSFLGLAAFPLVVEPSLSLSGQSTAWTSGFVALALLGAASAARAGAGVSGPREDVAGPVPARTQLTWVLLAFVPSALLHGVTTFITTEIAAAPLIWAIPLALYLLTFVLAFLRTPLGSSRLAQVLPIGIAVMIFTSLVTARSPGPGLFALHLAGFFAIALVLHRGLAERRPDPAQLTRFYFLIAVGGALGGLCSAILAPLTFRTPREYALMLVIAAALADAETKGRRHPLLICLAMTPFLLFGVRSADLLHQLPGHVFLGLVMACVVWVRTFRVARLGIGLLVLAIVGQFGTGPRSGETTTERSFYGVHRIVHDPRAGFNEYYNGTTLHGRQVLDPARSREAVTYYHSSGPVGDLMRGMAAARPVPASIGVVGLGVGSILVYGLSEQHWVFFELDEIVERFARQAPEFTFLSGSTTPFSVVIGDGRASLASREDRFGLLVLDSFSSDSVPVHLLTVEAFQLYMSRLADDGFLLLNMTNRYLDLVPVVAAIASQVGLVGSVRSDLEVSTELRRAGKVPSRWLVLSRKRASVEGLGLGPKWLEVRAEAGRRPWTDDYSNIVEAFGAKR